jgi:Right handed beta helix region
VLQVGTGKSYAQPSAAAAVAQSGDVVKIAAGDYRGDVATWSANNLTICGVGGRARLYADGRSAQGKGTWVIAGSNVVVDSVEFHDSKVPDQNGAGIRAEGNNLTVKNCGFFDNENGILGGDVGTVNIERSEFARNGYGDGFSHNIYIGPVDRLNVVASYFHEARIGHNLKSRAKETRIENSYFMDGPTGTASYLVDFPNGGVVYMRGNLLHKGPNADNSIAVAYGQEGANKPVNTLEMVHNTVVMTRSGGTFISAPGNTQSVKLTANLFAGTGSPALINGGVASGNILQQSNVVSSASNFSGADNVVTPNFWPNTTLQAQLGLSSVLDALYSSDTPQPMTLRSLSSPASRAGALQSKP